MESREYGTLGVAIRLAVNRFLLAVKLLQHITENTFLYYFFVFRRPLHKSWWGVRDEVLSEVANIEGCVFCHSTGFIGGNTTREGAYQMAVASLEADM